MAQAVSRERPAMRRHALLGALLMLAATLPGCAWFGGDDEEKPHTFAIRNDLERSATVVVTVSRDGTQLERFEVPVAAGATETRELAGGPGLFVVNATTEGATLSGTVELAQAGRLVVVALTTRGFELSTPA